MGTTIKKSDGRAGTTLPEFGRCRLNIRQAIRGEYKFSFVDDAYLDILGHTLPSGGSVFQELSVESRRKAYYLGCDRMMSASDG